MFISDTVRIDQNLQLCNVYVLNISKKPNLFCDNKIRQRFMETSKAYKVFSNTEHKCPEKSYNGSAYGG